MNRISSALLTVTFFAALTGPRTASAIWLGSATSDYESVGGIATMQGYYGSGTLIADRWILTAGHVADALDPAQPSYFAYGDELLRISNAYIHPMAAAYDYDLGLFELESPISGALFPTLFNGDFTGTAAAGYLGEEATLVGYGMNTSSNAGSEGVRRFGDNSISDVDASYLVFGNGGALGLFGDSGGSTWADFGLGEVLIGVHAFTISVDGRDPYQTFDLRIDRFQSWIDSTVGAGTVRWGSGTAAVSVPEPAPLSLLATGFVAVALIRRRQRRPAAG